MADLCCKTQRKHKPTRKKQRIHVYIPNELLEDILIRLPAKSLLRFKSVCKTWRSIIQSRPFITSHNQRHANDYSNKLVYSPYALCRRLFKKKSLVDMIKVAPGPLDLRLPPRITCLKRHVDDVVGVKPRRVTRVAGPVNNGIYLVVTMHEGARGSSIVTGKIKIALCNPATHDYKLISDPFPFESVFCNLTRKECRVHYGFGTTQARDCVDYKVVVVVTWGPRFSSFMSFVYSHKRSAWRKLVEYVNTRGDLVVDEKAVAGLFLEEGSCYPDVHPDLEVCPQRLFNGRWHWMVTKTDLSWSVMSFDFAEDSFKLMAAPPFVVDDDDLPYLLSGVLVLNDHLAAISYTSDPCLNIDVWMMMEYGVGESWTRIYAIEPELDGPITRLVGISSQGDVDDEGGYGIKAMFFQGFNSMLISCDASGYNVHDYNFKVSSGIWWNTLGISTYSETIEPLS